MYSLIKIKQGKTLENKLETLKILSIEDDTIIGEMLVMMLKHMGYEAISVEDAPEALDVYNEVLKSGKPFDLVITDLGLTEMDGLALSQEIKKITPNIPIILLTGFGSLVKNKSAGIVDCVLNKPLVQDELHANILKLMENRKKD
jgi:DNA-binding NtrC family response regulator